MKPDIRAIIIEDEEPARDLLKAYLASHENIQLVRECENGFEGIKAIAESLPDLIFLDIQMPKLTGFEMLELLDEHPEIIFTTAYDQFAIRAFEFNAVDYLMKPFSKERFDQALTKAFDRMKNKSESFEKIEKLKEKIREEGGIVDRIFVKTGNHIDVIPITDISHIEAQDDYIELYTPKGKFLKNETMTSVEKRLPQEYFIRVHRSSIINVQQIDKLEKYGKENYLIILKDKTKVMVSKSRVKQLKEQLGI
ncbi:MAG: LytTR family transcriptional regulator DNA-binding domain-containing protein [Bacteroidales bacterium]|nr:LytTR family transcriptional regulator DNA-binding domain-containing protein [Bacteroidales bacterium]